MCPRRATGNGVDSAEATTGLPHVPTSSTGNIAGQQKTGWCVSAEENRKNCCRGSAETATESIPNRAAQEGKSKGVTCCCLKPHSDASGRVGETPASIMGRNMELFSVGNGDAHAPTHHSLPRQDDGPGPSQETMQSHEERGGDDSFVPSPPEDDPALTGPLMLMKDGKADSVFLNGLIDQLESLKQDRDSRDRSRDSDSDSDSDKQNRSP